MLEKRKSHFQVLNNAIANPYLDENKSDDDDKEDYSLTIHSPDNSLDVDWQKFFLIIGEPSMGKSYVLKKAIEKFSSQGFKISVATPTGFLAT